MKIHRLPKHLHRAIKAGYVIPDATQCVLELVYNALDAGATSVAVRVNLKTFYLQVVDNGSGMTSDDLDLIGEEYITSKFQSEEQLDSLLDTFGYRGCALAALARTCSLLEIQTRHQSGTATHKKTIANGRLGPVEMSSSTRPAWGTTVTANDIFRALPVRRQRIKDIFDLDDILHQLGSLAVIYPDVSFSLRNDITGKVLLQTHRHGDCRPTLAHIFGLAENRSLVPIRFRQENIVISGYICRVLHSDNSVQLVYVNKRLVQSSKIHSQVLKDMKKYCRFWEKDRNDSDVIVDLDGYVFIVKILLPYQSFNIERTGRKSTLQLQNPEEVYTCIHRALKDCLQNDALERSACSDTPVLLNNEKERGTDFGPSQLEFALRGKQVQRVRQVPEKLTGGNGVVADVPQQRTAENVDGSETENRQNVGIIASSQNKEKGRKRRYAERESFETPKDVAKVHTEKKTYEELFFRESSGEEGTVAENAPIFEIGDFSLLQFHEFLAWLRVKENHDNAARKLLAELPPVQPQPSVVYTNKPVPLVSLKEIRKEKFAACSREMLNRFQKMSATYKETFQNNTRREMLVNRKMRTRTTTYIETHWRSNDESLPHTAQLPQVSFNEFMWWLKIKANHGEIVRLLLSEFKKFKTSNQLFTGHYVTPKPHACRSESLPEKGTVNYAPPSIQVDQEVSELHARNRKRKIERNAKIGPVKKQTRSRLEPKKTESKLNSKNPSTNPAADKPATPLFSSYYSHYQQSQPQPNPDHAKQISSTPQRMETSLICLDEMPDSDKSQEQEQLRETEKMTTPVVESEERLSYQRSIVVEAATTLVPSFCDKGIQVSVVTESVSIQVNSRVASDVKSVQTESAPTWRERQTAGNHTIPEPLMRESDTLNSLTSAEGTNRRALPASDGIPCGQPQVSNHQSSEPKSTEELPIPVVELEDEENLPDTVAADPLWEERTGQSGRRFFVHSVSGNSSFNPPSSSTRWSFGVQNVVGGVPQVSATRRVSVPNLKEDDLAELRAAISESCEENLANVKWSAGSNGKFGDQFVKWLEDGARNSDGDLGIPIGQVPKTESAIHQLLSSFAFSREHLKNMQVVGQLDKKFIVGLLKKPESNIPVICLFDQHAVDERITLERLMARYTKNNEFKSKDLAIPLHLPVAANTVNLVNNFPNHFIAHGLSLAAKDSQTCLVTSVPACFVRKQEREVAAHRLNLMKRLVTDLVDEVVKYSMDTRGAAVKKPKTIFNVIASEACRAAIKFNHSLELNEMTSLLANLSECQQPFQCAHGRPTLMPMYELSEAKEKLGKLNLRKFRRT